MNTGTVDYYGLEELLSEADSRMYLDKRRRKDAAAH